MPRVLEWRPLQLTRTLMNKSAFINGYIVRSLHLRSIPLLMMLLVLFCFCLAEIDEEDYEEDSA